MNQQPLRTALRANALFSALSGLALVVAAGPLAVLFDAGPVWIFRLVGALLLLFAVDLALTARRETIARPKALSFALADFGWVAGSAALVAFGGLPGAAAALTLAVALVVLAFGVIQYRTTPAA